MHLAQDRDQWPAAVSKVMNCRIHKSREISRPADWQLASQEELCSLELVGWVGLVN